MARYLAEYLAHVDAERWPGIASVPVPWRARIGSWPLRQVERRFAAAMDAAGLVLGSTLEDADVVIEHEEMLYRVLDAGWLGLAESYMAGEWRAAELGTVLTALFEHDGVSSARSLRPAVPRGRYDGGQLPAELNNFYTTDACGESGGIFASGVATTERVTRKAHPPLHSRGQAQTHHFVDQTLISEPIAVGREDMAEAHARAIDRLLDLAKITGGRDVLEYPLSRGAVAIRAAHRGASIDALTSDERYAAAVSEDMELQGVADSVHIHVIDRPLASRRDWRSRYESIVSVDRLAPMGLHGQQQFLRGVDRMLSAAGYAAIQTLVTGPGYRERTHHSLAPLRAYIWPALRYPSVDELHAMVNRQTSLRIIGEMYCGSHFAEISRLQGELFEAQDREAAAAGFDVTFRRLWRYHLALTEALLRRGELEAVQLQLTTRNRRGR